MIWMLVRYYTDRVSTLYNIRTVQYVGASACIRADVRKLAGAIPQKCGKNLTPRPITSYVNELE